MQNTKNSKEVQCTGTAQEQMNEQFNIATKELHFAIDLDSIQTIYENLIYAWIGSQNCDLLNTNQRANIYFFNRELLKLLRESASETKDINLFTEFFEGWCLKTAKNYFYEVYEGFLFSDESDDLNARQHGILLYREIKCYLEKIFEIDERFKSEMKLTT